MASLERLQQVIDYRFNDPALLELALSHRSVGRRNNERLEFLGDSIVNHVVAQALYQRFPQASEGEMSRMRAALVKGETLAEMAREFELGEYVVLGSGERKSGGHRRDSILADALEALAGAILLDSDLQQCHDCLLPWFEARLTALVGDTNEKDPKTRLQEYLQGRGNALPDYELVSVNGADHDQVFVACCRMPGTDLETRGEGSSRRRAEQVAATRALEALQASG